VPTKVIQPYAAAVGNDAYGLRATGIGLLVIERALHRREAEWAQRHLVADQLRWAREAVQRQARSWGSYLPRRMPGSAQLTVTRNE